MNYIWDYILQAEEAGLSEMDIHFIPAKSYSAYMELAFEDMNTASWEEKTVEINPYFRYYPIFKNLFLPDNKEYLNLRLELFDIIIHHLLRIDRYMGMNKEEFYIRFLKKDIENGCFGIHSKENFHTFKRGEQKILLHQILLLYKVGSSMPLFQKTFPLFFPNCSIYLNIQEKEEVLIYLGEIKEEILEKKKNLLIDLFLPTSYTYRIYWEYHFGILDVEETMHLENIQLY